MSVEFGRKMRQLLKEMTSRVVHSCWSGVSEEDEKDRGEETFCSTKC